MAVTARGRAIEVDARPPARVAMRIDVEHVQDHAQPTFAIDDGVQWRWTDADAERRDAEVRAALAQLA